MGRKVYFCMWALLCLSMRSHSQTMKKRDDFESVRDIGKSTRVSFSELNKPKKITCCFVILHRKVCGPLR